MTVADLQPLTVLSDLSSSTVSLEDTILYPPSRTIALLCYSGASLVAVVGVAMAATRFPGGFDWVYMVISRLGSSRHNPDGAHWLAASLLGVVCLLWPVAGHLGERLREAPGRPRIAVTAIRLGLIGSLLLALEGLVLIDLSRHARKGHEVVAFLTFVALYLGVVGLHVHRMRHFASSPWPAFLVVMPLCAVATSQLVLYFGQHDLGWVHPSWRELGVPFWLSFAFWQWLAVIFLGLGLGALLALGEGLAGKDRAPGSGPYRPTPARVPGVGPSVSPGASA